MHTTVQPTEAFSSNLRKGSKSYAPSVKIRLAAQPPRLMICCWWLSSAGSIIALSTLACSLTPPTRATLAVIKV